MKRIGLAFNLKKESGKGEPQDKYAEFDDITTVDAIRKAIEKNESVKHTINFVPSYNLDGLVIISGGGSPSIVDSDPLYEGGPLNEITPFDQCAADPVAIDTAQSLKEYLLWCYRELAHLPLNKARKKKGAPLINGLITQRAGQLKNIPSFSQRWGLSGLSIASSPMYWGLCRYLGMESIKVKDAHAVSYVLWPSDSNTDKYSIVKLDMTPSGLNDDEEALLAHLRIDPLSDLIERADQIKEESIKQAKQSFENLERLIREQDLQSLRQISNGELERMINAVTESGKGINTDRISSILDSVRYSGVGKVEVTNNSISSLDEQFKTFLETEVKRLSNKQDNKSKNDGGKATTDIITLIDDYAGRFANDESVGSKETAYTIIQNIFDQLNDSIDSLEHRIITLVTNYLLAQKI